MKIVVVTGNQGKFEEITHVLREYGIATEQRECEIEETGDTLEGCAGQKAQAAWKEFQEPAMVEDTGIFFSAYENFPGVRAKRAYQELGFDGLFKKLEGKSREAYFKTVTAYVDCDNFIHYFSGIVPGRIAERVSPHQTRPQFPYDRIFIPENEDQVMAELSLDAIAGFSHRAQAVRKLGAYLTQNR